MNGKIRAHLMMMVSFMLCNISSMVLGADMAIGSEENTSMSQESVFSEAPRYEGDVIEILSSDTATRETANLRCKRFEWLGTAENGIAQEERLNTFNRALDIGSSGK